MRFGGVLAGLAMVVMVIGAAAQGTDTLATATLSDSGIVVRFPRSMSPDSITREMPVMDLFSGYEWRVALVSGDRALLAALVVAPNDSLRIHRYATIKDAYMAGDLRSCQRNVVVLECDRLARGLVRDVNGRVEIAIVDRNWLLMALQATDPVVRLIVKRDREILWTADLPLANHLH
jgi:hypothetical protein